MKTHLEIQQREDIRRDPAERMKFVPPDLRTGQHVFYWQEDPNKFQQVGWSFKFYCFVQFFQVNARKPRRPLDTVDLEELPDSREGTGVPVLWLSREGQTDVWELFSDNSFSVPVLIDKDFQWQPQLTSELKKSERFFTTAVARAFGRSSKIRIPSSSWCPRR